MQFEFFRNSRNTLTQTLELGQRHTRVGSIGPFTVQERHPVNGILAFVIRQYRIMGMTSFVHGSTVIGCERIDIRFGNYILRNQLVSIELARAGMLTDFFIHQGLGHCWCVLLIVTQLTEADNVNHDIAVEFLAIIDGNLRCQYDRFGVIAIDMQDRCFNHLDHVRTIDSRARIARVGCGKTNLVINDDMNGAASTVAACLRQIQGFHHHTLAGKRGIAMHQYRNDLVTLFVTATILTSTYRTLDDWIHDFKVRGVKGQRQVQRATGCSHIA